MPFAHRVLALLDRLDRGLGAGDTGGVFLIMLEFMRNFEISQQEGQGDAGGDQ